MRAIHKPWILDTYMSRSVPDMPDPLLYTNLIFDINGNKVAGSLDSGVPIPMIESSVAAFLGLKDGDEVLLTLPKVGTVKILVKTWYFTSFPPKLFLDHYDIIFTPYEAIFTPRIHDPIIPFVRTGSTKKRPHSDYSGFIKFAINGKMFDGLLDTGEYKPVMNHNDGKITNITKYPKADMVFWDGYHQGYKVPLKIVGGPTLNSIIYLTDAGENDFSMSVMAAAQIIDRGYHIIFTEDGVDMVWSGQIVRNRKIHL